MSTQQRKPAATAAAPEEPADLVPPEEEFAGLSVRDLLLELDRVEQSIRSTGLYQAQVDGGDSVNPDLVALAEREQAITAEMAHRHTTFNEWFAYRVIDSTRT